MQTQFGDHSAYAEWAVASPAAGTNDDIVVGLEGGMPGLIDARPILPRTQDGIWARSEAERDRVYAAFESAARTAGYDALILKSGPFVQPAWVRFEAWVPRSADRALTERAAAVVTIEAKPYHRFEFEYKVDMFRRERTDLFPHLHRFGPQDAGEVVRYLVGRGPRPRYLLQNQLRQTVFQVWKPRNKFVALRRHWLEYVPLAVLAAVAGYRMLPRSADPFQSGAYYDSHIEALIFGSGLIGWAVLIFGVLALHWAIRVALYARVAYTRTSGRPAAEPRALTTVDAWQTVVFGLGADADGVRRRLLAALGTSPPAGFRCQSERIWHWGLDGKEERDQIVLTLGRGMVFCQLYRYDRDLYVGWDAHLNRGQWIEQPLGRGVDRATGRRAALVGVVTGTQNVTEYDVTDLSCLTEWVHAQLVRLVKQVMDERKIDQEIDFKILRGDRQHLVGSGGNQPQGGGRKLLSALRRVG